MTKIDFYFNASDKFEIIRKLVVKAIQAGNTVLIYTKDSSLLQRMDQYLWSAPALSFLPHTVCGHPLSSKTLVLIGDDPMMLKQYDVLINIDNEVPGCYSRFARILEVVGEDAQDRQYSRQRFRYYKERGFELDTHDLKGG